MMVNNLSPFFSKLRSVLTVELASAKSVCVAAALFSKKGVEELQELTQSDATVEILVGLDLPTPPAALARLLKWSQESERVSVRVWVTPDTYFHPKVYLVKQVDKWVAFVGSANCTESGWQHNEELSTRVAGTAADDLQESWFRPRFREGVLLTSEFIEEYSASFASRDEADQAAREAARKARQAWQKWLAEQRKAAEAAEIETSLKRPVRLGQYFREEHYAAFDGTMPLNETAAANRERYKVYDQMMRLHRSLEPLVVAAGWDLHPHYEPSNVVSSPEHTSRTEKAIRAMWLNYGRHKDDIKSYGREFTPMVFIRLEVIIFNNHLATWCRIGKDGAFDRDAFKAKMLEPSNRADYFALLQALGERYFIEVQGIKKTANAFESADSLANFVRSDRQGSYLVIGKDYEPNDHEISEALLPQTIMRDWAHLYQVYQWMRRHER
ncbi:phospholipase D-like domain-containing protein [Hymenobacter jeollabukensis]|uniref:Phospholipase D-like domain-containing protein n=1 Tax=Hymenobacter jeollabukensis TaxID=2025313 RepID=A0A5R8WHB3_9BACT|nr:phospholipase D-like domain-containing protein [Hymenobacter jeollabukensis]TLM87859.1 hypothetical protein FDY95_25530 [Hymenobacter jeollabukensis]